jgi:hypothetical protein
MTIHDAEHYSAEDRQRIIDSYPPHERDARARGIPILGSGRVFPIEEALIKVPAFAIPAHWARINGIDFGIDHPFAAVSIAWDRDNDCIYVTNAFRRKDELPVAHAAAVKSWGTWIPCAWPHDGLNRDKGSGEQLAEQYRSHGLKMTEDKASHDEGGNGVEAGLMDMLERMQTERLKVFDTLNDWFEEFRLYHRKNGMVVKLLDDLMSATRYAIMMKRFAVVNIVNTTPRRIARYRA